MMKIKKKIVWKYVLSVNILLLPIAFGVLMIDADSPEKNIQITVRVKDKSCFKASHDLLFNMAFFAANINIRFYRDDTKVFLLAIATIQTQPTFLVANHRWGKFILGR